MSLGQCWREARKQEAVTRSRQRRNMKNFWMVSSTEGLRGWNVLQLHAPILQYELRDLERDVEMQEHRYGQT